MSRRSRSSRSSRSSARASQPLGRGFGAGDPLAWVTPVEPGDLASLVQRLAPDEGTCSSCLRPSRRVDLADFLAAWARTTEDGPDPSVVDDLVPGSLRWCDACDRGSAVWLTGGERVSLGIGGSCSCCA